MTNTKFGKLAVPESYLSLPAWHVYTDGDNFFVVPEGTAPPEGSKPCNMCLYAEKESTALEQIRSIARSFPGSLQPEDE
jgi:hypothetical protein